MTHVSNCLIHIASHDTPAAKEIAAKVFLRENQYGTINQRFERIRMNGWLDYDDADDYTEQARPELAGGSVMFEGEVYAAALNHIYEPEIVEWFKSLPWGEFDNASLTIHGNDFSTFVIKADGHPIQEIKSA